jgi:natural product biosynthesis luciferase-like monooxygenase protein
MSELTRRLMALSPAQRDLLERELKRKNLSAPLLAHTTVAAAEPEAGRETSEQARGSFAAKHSDREMKFSLFFFSDDGAKQTDDKYCLLLESARYADENGFCAVWTPERHFQEFGGLYPNPSVLGAALAMITKRLQIRAGSVALPLHNPLRVAEEWSVVDNLSRGRVGISVASGWHPLDFVLQPGSYADRKDLMFQSIQTIRKLWRGEQVTLEGVDGDEVSVRILPHPVQAELPIWVTIAGSRNSWIRAGEIGANVLTAILREPLSVLAGKIKLYREARAQNGHDPEAGEVTVMLHTFVGEDDRVVKEQVRGPLCDYFRTNIKQLGLQKEFFMARQGMDTSLDVESMIESDLDSIVSFAFERYYDTTLLCGTPDKCAGLIDRLSEVGVNEAACLIDFGLSHESVMESLGRLTELKERYSRQPLSTHATL